MPLSPTVHWAKVVKVSQASWREEVDISAKQAVGTVKDIWRGNQREGPQNSRWERERRHIQSFGQLEG